MAAEGGGAGHGIGSWFGSSCVAQFVRCGDILCLCFGPGTKLHADVVALSIKTIGAPQNTEHKLTS
jgi:hypothetical protein